MKRGRVGGRERRAVMRRPMRDRSEVRSATSGSRARQTKARRAASAPGSPRSLAQSQSSLCKRRERSAALCTASALPPVRHVILASPAGSALAHQRTTCSSPGRPTPRSRRRDDAPAGQAPQAAMRRLLAPCGLLPLSGGRYTLVRRSPSRCQSDFAQLLARLLQDAQGRVRTVSRTRV